MKKYLIKKGERRSIKTEIKKGQRLSPKTEFKKGFTPHNKKPVGYITTRKDKNGTRRRHIKIGEGKYEWKVYATWLWEKNGNKIPKEMFIHHIDGDALNDNLSNYKLINRAEHITIHRRDLNKARNKKYELHR